MKFRYEACWLVPAVVLVCAGLVPLGAEAQFFQQGPKLVGTGAVNTPAGQGYSVSLSGDGDTAIVGGPFDNFDAGAAWVFTRSGTRRPSRNSKEVWTQQMKLVGTGAVNTPGPAEQGHSVALSGDGNTALVGGPFDNFGVGAVWVFTRSGTRRPSRKSKEVWTQQGDKLVGAVRTAGWSVALSDDGNTAIVGGPLDNGEAGAACVFTRSSGVWTQQGGKLIGTDAVGTQVVQGTSVALSGDGNTAIVGGPGDNNGPGAAWVFTRSDGVWTQQMKLVGTGAVGTIINQGESVALSGDGNTAIVGGSGDNNGAGAAWIFTRSGGVWTQQGDKLVGTLRPGVFLGSSVSLSSDGNTAIVGGPLDNRDVGAARIFTRSGGEWTQQIKLVGTGAVGTPEQGGSVSLSGDGNTALVGGLLDNGDVGAAWVFVQPVFAGTPGKANCHGQSVSALAKQYGGLNNAAAALGFDSVNALQKDIGDYCEA
jgi:hypothetical protein